MTRATLRNAFGRRVAIVVVAAGLAAIFAAGAIVPAAAHRHPAHRRARTVRVGIRSFAFHPHALRVKRGTKVVFANDDSVAHTATRAGGFDTGHIRPGRSVAVRFAQRGVYVYHCTIHPFMHGRIVVR